MQLFVRDFGGRTHVLKWKQNDGLEVRDVVEALGRRQQPSSFSLIWQGQYLSSDEDSHQRLAVIGISDQSTLHMTSRLPGSGGKLYFYYSAMNAGKTTTLLQSSFNYHERGMKTLLFTPRIDDRYTVGEITSRIGLSAQAVPFDSSFDFYDFTLPVHHSYACLLVDEAQFLTKTQVHQLCRIVDELNRPVLAYGLRSDFLGEPFEGSRYLLTWADVLTEIKTICHCGRKASFNARMDEQGRKVEDGEQIVIGGNDRYVSVCRRHFHSGLLQPDHLKSGTSLADSAIDLAEVFEKS